MIYVKIGQGRSINYESIASCLFYNKLSLTFSFSDGKVLETSLLPNRVSFSKNRKLIYEKISLFEKRFNEKVIITNYDRTLFLGSIFFYLCLILKNIITKFFMPNQWIIAYRRLGDTKWIKLKYKKNELMADPFIYHHDNKYYVFYEALNYDVNKGYIAVGELDVNKNRLKNIKTVINEDYHLSFPYLCKINDELYMIPESSENNTIDLYKCLEFPHRWHKIKTLINNIQAVDSILIEKEGMWYLFTSEKISGASYGDELTIFTTKDPLTLPFRKMSDIPFVNDISLSRNAGAIYMDDKGSLYRVSQDCSRRYGYRVNILKIKQLSQTVYSEELVSKLDLPKNAIAMHTYNASKEIEITDLKIINKDIYSLIKNTFRILKRIVKKR
ncbi:glucosamine inositolphosphorylceramide transferase family protein [Xenorhabdus szentirmaii]|uniref:Glucosamine inositolphosphorylceramide transferase 1 N-terminal domain-containing protein n=1 Tax=Xenorhabdus szentirmaii DSM 16338 TaxID=1427518 RepID=W1J2L4_9GAMM|nr:hypothetical protein [Xenorhabdus szentirmaii]PHM34346.1 hypothetical protein Xsze_00769 [Xenorhabdus szentirmaii DSM 16338]CDL84096.1 conserved hypothetical protein [Xenorhabdus szentirmaii DSM 16338]